MSTKKNLRKRQLRGIELTNRAFKAWTTNARLIRKRGTFGDVLADAFTNSRR
jgi:hypothetical protein